MIRELTDEKERNNYLDSRDGDIGVFSAFGAVIGDNARMVIVQAYNRIWLASRGEFEHDGIYVRFKKEYLPVVKEILSLQKQEIREFIEGYR